MPWYLNPFGQEIHLTKKDIDFIVKQGDLKLFQPRAFRHEGQGLKNKVAIIFSSNNGSNGIGDYVHAMPALTAKVQSGFECHVWTTEFFRPFIEWCGATFHDGSLLGVGSIAKMQLEFGVIHSLVHWCIEHDEQTFGDVHKTRFEQIAEFLGVELPDRFSWDEIFPAHSLDIKPFGIIATQSTARERSYTHTNELRSLAEKGTGVFCARLGGGNAHKEDWMLTAKTIEELILLIRSAPFIVTVDNGILALALAMEIPVVAIFGPTDENTIVWQFSRYVDTSKVRIVRSLITNEECRRPCSMQNERGYGANQKCTKDRSVMVDCMAEIEPEQIVSELTKLLAQCQK